MSSSKYFSAPHSISTFMISVILVICVGASIVMYKDTQSYELDKTLCQARPKHLVQLLSEYIDMTLVTTDQRLSSILEKKITIEKEHTLVFTPDQPFLKDFSPYITAISLIDEEGMVRYNETKEGNYSPFVVNEEWKDYQDFKKNALLFSEGSYIKQVYFNKDNTKNFIVIGHPIMHQNNQKQGMICATIDVNYITHLLESVTSHQNIDLAVMMTKGSILTLSSKGKQDFHILRQILSYIENHTALKEEEITEHFSKERHPPLVMISSLRHLPLKVVMVLHHPQMLEYWNYHRTSYILFFALLLVFILAIYIYTTSMSKHIHKAQQSEQAALLASQAKTEFLAKMSHELRTPLNAIIGFSEMMDVGYFGPLNDKQQERTRDINLCGTHLLELINDILEFSKGEAGKLTIQEEVIVLSDIFDKTIRIICEKAKNDKISLIHEPNPMMPLLRADKRKIRQICLNLLSNAVKFTKEGGLVKISSWIDMQGQCVIMVEDTGIGMLEQDVPKALSVFGQVHDDLSEGAGLGLPLCKMITELHGGELKIVTTKGEGTKVYIILPKERVMNPNDENDKDAMIVS